MNVPTAPSVRMRALPSSDGYDILNADGTVSSFGAAKFWGSASGSWAVDLMLATSPGTLRAIRTLSVAIRG